MVVPKCDVRIPAIDDMPMAERATEGERARGSHEVISDDFGSMGLGMGEGLSSLAIAGAVPPSQRTNRCSNA